MAISPFERSIPKNLEKDKTVFGFIKNLVDTIYELFFFANEFAASQIFSVEVSTSIRYLKRINRVVGSGGAVIVTAIPSILPLSDGKEIIIQGTDDVNTVTLQDESNLANSGLALDGGLDMILGKGDIIFLVYNQEDTKFYEISRSNN